MFSPPQSEREALIAIGSNLGDRLGTISKCIHFLDTPKNFRIISASRVYESNPIGPVPDQPRFLNAAVRIATSLDPLDLLRLCLQTEERFGRVRDVPQGPRTLDLDIIAVSDLPTLNHPRLTLPHPRATSRNFVILPLAEIAPDWQIRNRPIREWAQEVDPRGIRLFSEVSYGNR